VLGEDQVDRFQIREQLLGKSKPAEGTQGEYTAYPQ
jgi:hypothetical protein